MSDKFLSGRVAWVTGGASGMGRATALALAKAGANVAIGSLVSSQRSLVIKDQNCFTPDDADLAATKEEIEREGVEAFAGPLDVGSDESVGSFHGAVLDRFGKIDILINAAGTSARKYMIDHPDEIWRRLIDINLNGPYRTIKLCFPGMIERSWGRIVNFAATAANVGYPMYSAYCASKSGLLGLTRCVGLEGAPHRVTCNAINPGFVETGSNYSASIQEMEIQGLEMTVEEYRAGIAQTLPQKRFLSPHEVAALALFLCREEALGIEAQDITIAMGSQW